MKKFLIISDPGRDQDDEDVLVMANLFIRFMLMEMSGLVANLAPSLKRAYLAKNTLTKLGQGQIPVAVGTGCGQPEDDGLDYQFDVPYFGLAEVGEGKDLLRRQLESSEDKGISLILISGLTDASLFLCGNTELFKSKVADVTIMGGVLAEGDAVLIKDGFILPDLSAQNHKFDTAAAESLYFNLQKMEIPMTILSRHAAGAAKVPRRVYDDMAATGHPVGVRLRDAQMKAIEELWRRSNLPAGHQDRMGLPDRCDKQWFCQAFLGGEGTGLGDQDSVWNLVKTFMLYDPMTFIAAIPELSRCYYDPAIVKVGDAEHAIIGVSAKNHNVKNPEALVLCMVSNLVHSLVMAKQEESLKVA